MGQLLETCGRSSHIQPAESSTHTTYRVCPDCSFEGGGGEEDGRAVSHSISNHLQWRGAHTVRVCVCKYMRISVTVLSFNPLQHAESWKLLPDIHKQWPRKTMQTRCLGSFPCPRVQQLAELSLPPPTALDLQRQDVAPSVDLRNRGEIPLQLSRNQIIPH